jgi:hypothetical protein
MLILWINVILFNFNSLHPFPVRVMNYIFKYKQAVFAHYLSDVIPLFLFYITEKYHQSAVRTASKRLQVPVCSAYHMDLREICQ